jgi:hypothetical protein
MKLPLLNHPVTQVTPSALFDPRLQAEPGNTVKPKTASKGSFYRFDAINHAIGCQLDHEIH